MASKPVNATSDGLCRKLKAQYYKNSKANLRREHILEQQQQ